MGNTGSIIGEEEIADQLLKGSCVCLQSPEVEQTAVKMVANVHSVVIIKACLSIMLRKIF